MPNVKLKLKILSPVHIGSGETLREGLDFTEEDGAIHVVSIDKLIERFKDRPEVLDRMSSAHFVLRDFLRDFGVKAAEISKYSLPGSLPARSDIRTGIKTGMGYPIIPGSSLKGSFRTAVLWDLTHDEKRDYAVTGKALKVLEATLSQGRQGRIRDKFAARQLEAEFVEKAIMDPTDSRQRKNIQGPNNSLMRILQIPDARFELSDLVLVRVQATSESTDGYLWEVFGRNRPNAKNHRHASPIFIEALRPGSESEISVKLDDFLIKEARKGVRYNPGKEGSDILSGIGSLFKGVNDRSFELMDGECDLLDEFSSRELNPALNFYYDQMERIKDEGESTDLCIFSLGWGTGWRGMTGPIVPKEMLKDFRRTFGKMSGNMGWKKSFPKTRKFCFEGNDPGLPPGWVELKIEK